MLKEILSKLKEGVIHFKKEGDVVLLVGLLLLCIIVYIWRNDKRKNLPPGPRGVPLFGYYFSVVKDPIKAMHEVTKKYGNVVGLYIGSKYLVVVNDWEAVKDSYGQNATNDRPSEIFEVLPFKLGFGGINGEAWVQTRRLAVKAMKDIGLHSTVWEELIQEEIRDIVDTVKQKKDLPIDIVELFHYSFMNTILTLVLGKRLPTGHPLTKFLTHTLEDAIEGIPTLGLANFSPILFKIMQILGVEKKLPFEVHQLDELRKKISETVDDVLQSPDSENDESFIQLFRKQINSFQKNSENLTITEEMFKGSVLALLAGGSDTSRTSLLWLLIAMADNQDKQRKVHEELDRTIGKDGSIRWSDRAKVPYTFAAIMESMRWKTLVPLSTMRKVGQDTKIQGYDIPKGTFLTTNIYSLHNDPKYWKDPERFVPERFLLENGQQVNTAHDSFDPFSYGKRNCPGKLMANMSLLQYFCILMQNFKVVPTEGNKVKHNAILGITYEATDVKMRFILR